MERILAEIHAKHCPGHLVFVGGAPVNQELCGKISASFYAPDPQSIERLNTLAA